MEELTKYEEAALNNYVYTPAESSSGFVKFAKEIQSGRGVTFGVESLDNAIVPIRAGRSLGILAEPGHGKTTLGGYLCMNEAKRLIESGDAANRYVVHASWEQPVEELEAMYQEFDDYGVTDVVWGRVPMSAITRNSMSRADKPIWLFGDSLYKSSFETPPMTVERMMNAIHAIHKKWDKTPSLIFLDYIQDVPVPSERDRHTQVSSAMRLARRLSIQAKCPLILGIQAGRKTGDQQVPIPTLRDAEWSNVIGQKLDTLVALWRPIRTFLPAKKPNIKLANGVEYPNEDDLLVVKLLKQRGDKGYGIWGLRFDPNNMTLADYPVRSSAFYRP